MAELPAKVRVAVREDEPELLRLAHMLHEENGMMPLDVGCVRYMFSRAFDRDGAVIGVIGPRDDIQGMIALLISRWWYSASYHLEELFNFVRQDCRKTTHARTLIGFAKGQSDYLKIPLVIGVVTNKRMAEKIRLYQRVLGPPSGAFFVYGGTWQNECDKETWANLLRSHGRGGGKIQAA